MTVHIWINQEPFLLARHVSTFIKKHVDASMRDFNYDRVDADHTSMSKIIDLAKTPPMMAVGRCVLVDQSERFKKDDWELLIDEIDSLSAETQLVFIAAKIDKRTGYFKKLGALVGMESFAKPYDSDLPRFIAEEAKRMGLVLERDVPALLVQLLGNDLGGLVGELEKLSLYVLPQKQVGIKDVNHLVSHGVLQNVFVFSQCIAAKNHAEAMRVTHQLIEQGESLIGLMAMLTSHFRKLLLASESQRLPKNELAAAIGVAPFFVGQYLDQLKQFAGQSIKSVYQSLMQTSLAMRSSRLSDDSLFYHFLQSVCVR